MQPSNKANKRKATAANPSPQATKVERNAWVGKVLAVLGLIGVAIVGFGSSNGWFSWHETVQRNIVEREAPLAGSPRDPPAASGLASVVGQATSPSGSVPAVLPPVAPSLPDEGIKLLEEGKRVAEHLVSVMPTSIEAKEMQARFEFEFGETSKAEQLWKEILKVNPEYAHALKGLGDVSNINGNLPEAVIYYRRAVLADPNNLARQLTLGIALMYASQFEDSKRTFEAILARDQKRSDAHVELANVLSQLQDFEGARDHFQTALKTHPEMPEIHFGLTNAYNRLGDREKARYHQQEHQRLRIGTVAEREKGRRTYDDLIALRIDVGKLYTDMARTYLAGGHRDACGLLLLRASRMNSNDPECRRALAYLAVNQGKIFDGIRWLTELRLLTPNDLSITKEIARLHLQNQQPQAAEKILVDFWENHPDQVEAVRELARFYVEVQRDEERAIHYGLEAVELASTAESHAMLASIYDAFERLNDAIESLEKATKVQPDNTSYQQALALLRDMVRKQAAEEKKP